MAINNNAYIYPHPNNQNCKTTPPQPQQIAARTSNATARIQHPTPSKLVHRRENGTPINLNRHPYSTMKSQITQSMRH